MIIPGVQTAHWMARAGWLAGALLAVCGILTGAFTEGIIHLVFEEDLSKGNTGGHDRLNLNADAEILHRVDEVLCMPSTVRARLLPPCSEINVTKSMIFSGVLFLAGGAIFAGSADSEPPSTTPKRGAFALIAISPSFVYLLSFSIQLLETIYSKRATPQSESEGNTRPISPYSPSLLGLPLAPTTGATGVLVGPSLRTGDLARRVPERKHVAFTPTILFHSMLSSPASPANPLPSATTASQNLSSSILSSSLSAGGFEVVDLDLGGTGIEVTGDISRQPATEVDDLHDRKPYDLLVRYAEMEHRVGKLPGAESAYREAIFGLEQCLGRHHLDTLKAMTGLAEVLYEKGVFEEAETMLSEVLYERERVLGREHPDTQDALSQLANILYHERKVPEAERIYKEVFDRRERALGGGHSDTLDALASLARINYDQGRIAAAQEMYETVISGREKALGQRHSDTLDALACLAKIYFDRGEYPEAIVKFKEVVLGRDSTRGLGAVDALIAIEYLAKIYYKQGNLQEAAELFRGALAERERMQGRDDPDTLTAIDYLHRHLYGTSPPYGRVR